MPLRRIGRPGLIGMAARTAVVAGTATAVSGSVQRHQQAKAQNQYEQEQYEAQQQQEMQAMAQQAAAQQAAQQQATLPAAAPAPADDMMTKLQQLGTLHAQGVLTDDEFAAAKAKLLA